MAKNQLSQASDCKRKVLIVDDSRDVAEAPALFLLGNGHEMRSAYDGPKALQAVNHFNSKWRWWEDRPPEAACALAAGSCHELGRVLDKCK
jgi:CheY-like chemotaxis protein